MENASHAFLDAVRKSVRLIRVAIGAAKIDPDLLTAAETIQYEGYLRREETNAVILGLAKDGVTIKVIVRRTGMPWPHTQSPPWSTIRRFPRSREFARSPPP